MESFNQLIRDLQFRPWTEIEKDKDKVITTLIRIQAKLNESKI